jgi:hypothetical protein
MGCAAPANTWRGAVRRETVRAYFRDGGVSTERSRAVITAGGMAEARRLHAGGIGTRELGAMFGVSHTTMAK